MLFVVFVCPYNAKDKTNPVIITREGDIDGACKPTRLLHSPTLTHREWGFLLADCLGENIFIQGHPLCEAL